MTKFYLRLFAVQV